VLRNSELKGRKMAQCVKCKKELSYFSKVEYNGKIYCSNCRDKVVAKDDEKKKKEKHIKDAKKAVLREYDFDSRKFIIHLIKTWMPRGCKGETDYTRSLKQFLDKELTPVDIYVGKESGLDSSRLDLVVGKKKPYREFAIELKLNLNKSPNFDRLKGQIHTYIVGKFKHVIILLIGKTEPRLETELKKYNKDMLSHYSSSYPSSLKTIDVIKKR